MKPGLVKLFRVGIPLAFYLLLAVFLAIYIAGIDWAVLGQANLSVPFLLFATALSLGYRYWGVMIWFFLLKRLGASSLKGQYLTLTYIYAKSWLGRYIPGAATWILGKIYFASRHGISKGRLAVSGLLEGALQIVTTLALALLLLLLDSRTAQFDVWVRVATFAVFVLCVVALIPRIFEFLLNIALRIFRRPRLSKDLLPDLATMGLTALLYTLGALFAGGSYFLIAAAIYPEIDWGDALFIIGASSLASAISMLAIFAPGGLGVREGILGVLLSIVVPGEIALLIVVVTRVWSILVDLVFFGVTGGVHLAVRGLLRRFGRHEGASSQQDG